MIALSGPEFVRKPRDEIINEILESIAKEEMAIANLMNAEAEKIKRVVGSHDLPKAEDFSQLLSLQKLVAEILEKLIQKQNIIIKKLDMIREFKATIIKKEKPHPYHPMPQYDNEE